MRIQGEHSWVDRPTFIGNTFEQSDASGISQLLPVHSYSVICM